MKIPCVPVHDHPNRRRTAKAQRAVALPTNKLSAKPNVLPGKHNQNLVIYPKRLASLSK